MFLLNCCSNKLNLDFTDTTPGERIQLISKHVNVVDGQAVGYGASPGMFQIFSEKLIEYKDAETCNLLIKDTSDVLKLLGLYCLMNIDSSKYKANLEKYKDDTSEVPFQPFGCIVKPEKMNNIVQMISDNPRFLGLYEDVEMDSLSFEADIDSISGSAADENTKYCVNYKGEIINHLSDTCEIFVGADANYLLTLTRIKYHKNLINLDSADLLLLHIHSPAKTFGSGDKIEKGNRFYFKMFYKKKFNGNFHFLLLCGEKAE
jgi:hypothetical protein